MRSFTFQASRASADAVIRAFRVEAGSVGWVWKANIQPAIEFSDETFHCMLNEWMDDVASWLEVKDEAKWVYGIEGGVGADIRPHAHGAFSMGCAYEEGDELRIHEMLEHTMGCAVRLWPPPQKLYARGVEGWLDYSRKGNADRARGRY